MRRACLETSTLWLPAESSRAHNPAKVVEEFTSYAEPAFFPEELSTKTSTVKNQSILFKKERNIWLPTHLHQLSTEEAV